MPTVTAASYGLAAIAYGVLAVLLAVYWRDRMRGSLLLLAVALTVVWALANVLIDDHGDSVGGIAVELAKSLGWIVFLARALSAARHGRISPWLHLVPVAGSVLALLLATYASRAGAGVAGLPSIERTLVAASLALAIYGFVLVEQAFRNTRASEHWAVKFLWLGVGAVFAYDIALFSASYVLGSLQTELWAARGFAVASAAPLLALGVARVREFQPQLLMSQKLAFYTGSVVAAGAYLLLVSVAGYYVRVLGGTWGAALQIVLVFAALMALAVAVFSSAVRARLRVELAKHFFPYKYDYRTEWLDLTERLTRDAEGSSLAQRTVEAFARLARAGGGGVWVRRDDALQPVAGGLAASRVPSEPAESAFCRFLEEHEWIVDLDGARSGGGRDGSVPVPAWLIDMRDAWLAIPLLHERRIVALVVVQHPLAPQQLTWEDLDLLRTAGRQAASYFALDLAAEALGRERQFAAFNRFSAFMMHDLSNILAQQRLIVENAARHRRNPAFIDDAIDTIENTVRRMTRLLEQMKSGDGASIARVTVLVDVAERAVRNLADRQPAPELVAEDTSVSVVVAADRLEHVLEHVIRNALDATPPEGSVRVVVRADASSGVIEVADTGRGMDADFVRERLFRPFDTTKGVKGMGIGAFQTREFVRAAGGDVQVSSTPGCGTSFVIRLPRA